MFIAGPVFGMLGALVVAAVLLGTINFGFGGRAKFGDVFAVVYYAWLPQVVKVLLGTAVIYAGMAPESFNIKNFAPTNLGAFLDPMDTNKCALCAGDFVRCGDDLDAGADEYRRGDGGRREAQRRLHCCVRMVGDHCVLRRGGSGGDGISRVRPRLLKSNRPRHGGSYPPCVSRTIWKR